MKDNKESISGYVAWHQKKGVAPGSSYQEKQFNTTCPDITAQRWAMASVNGSGLAQEDLTWEQGYSPRPVRLELLDVETNNGRRFAQEDNDE